MLHVHSRGRLRAVDRRRRPTGRAGRGSAGPSSSLFLPGARQPGQSAEGVGGLGQQQGGSRPFDAPKDGPGGSADGPGPGRWPLASVCSASGTGHKQHPREDGTRMAVDQAEFRPLRWIAAAQHSFRAGASQVRFVAGLVVCGGGPGLVDRHCPGHAQAAP